MLNPRAEATYCIYYGPKGSGKSYSAAAEALAWLRTGNPVLTNMVLTGLKPRHQALYHYLTPDELRPQPDPLSPNRTTVPLIQRVTQLTEQYPGKALLLTIDEAHHFYGARDYKQFPPEFHSFLAQSRKYRCTVLIVTQHYDNLDVQLRRICDEFREHINLAKSTLLGPLLCLITPHLHFARSYGRIDDHPDPRHKMAPRLFLPRPSVYKHYPTNQLVTIDDGRTAPPLTPTAPLRKRLLLWTLIAWAALAANGLTWYQGEQRRAHKPTTPQTRKPPLRGIVRGISGGGREPTTIDLDTSHGMLILTIPDTMPTPPLDQYAEIPRELLYPPTTTTQITLDTTTPTRRVRHQKHKSPRRGQASEAYPDQEKTRGGRANQLLDELLQQRQR